MKSVTSVAICSCRSVGANVGLLSGGTASAAAGTRPPAQAPASTNAVANKPVLILFIIPDPSSIPTQRRHLRPAEARLECPDPPIKGKRHTFATLDKPYAATHHNHRHRPRLGGLHQPWSRRGHADLSHPRGRVSAARVRISPAGGQLRAVHGYDSRGGSKFLCTAETPVVAVAGASADVGRRAVHRLVLLALA